MDVTSEDVLSCDATQKIFSGFITDPPSKAQFMLLLHAQNCQLRESQSNGGAQRRQCKLPHCQTLKGVLNHIMSCQREVSSGGAQCTSMRQIMDHWKHCSSKSECHICSPLM